MLCRSHSFTIRVGIIIILLMRCCLSGFSQSQDSIRIVEKDTTQEANNKKTLVSGGVSVTNNGISLVPAFSLEKPATIFDLAVKRNRFSFEPELAFAFKDAKPWYFVFWLRYKLIESQKFKTGIGFHPGFLFGTTNVPVDGVNKEYFTTARFFVGAISPTYTPSKDISLGVYYQYSRGYNIDLKQSQFLGVNGNFSNIRLTKKYYLKAAPQVYYLRNDNKDGFYTDALIVLAKKDFPFSVSTLLNKKIQSDIESKDFLWNLTLTYSF